MSGHGMHQDAVEDGLEEMWMTATRGIQEIDPGEENWKIQTLPLARIKKIMKSEEFILQELEKDRQQKLAAEEGRADVSDTEKPAIKFMISGEAPVLMSKACELMVKDLSFRAWRHTERNRRRTLQKQDVHAAVGESEVYDFLIDIVPRVTSSNAQKIPNPPPLPAPPPPPVAGLAGGAVGHAGFVGIPHGVPMQMHGGMNTGISQGSVSTLSQGMVGTVQDDSGSSGMMHGHHANPTPVGQPTQQPAYQYVPTQTQHIPQQQQGHHVLHEQHHSHHQNNPAGGMTQQHHHQETKPHDGSITHPGAGHWLQ